MCRCVGVSVCGCVGTSMCRYVERFRAASSGVERRRAALSGVERRRVASSGVERFRSVRAFSATHRFCHTLWCPLPLDRCLLPAAYFASWRMWRDH